MNNMARNIFFISGVIVLIAILSIAIEHMDVIKDSAVKSYRAIMR
ncbi:MAG: hypothetical protein ACQEWU_10195 [Bacillota bacterium]|nr:hypothetical protein [Virgibacillus sp. Bac332]